MEYLRRPWARVTDTSTCVLLNLAQWRHRHQATTREELETYLAACQPLTADAFYAAPRTPRGIPAPPRLADTTRQRTRT
jgi:hypothetical protein